MKKLEKFIDLMKEARQFPEDRKKVDKIIKGNNLDKMIANDEMIKVWHGTTYFWCVYMCVHGIDGTVPPPSVHLGKGNFVDGFGKKIDTSGLYVSPNKPTSFTNFVTIEVKPSELSETLEVSQLGYKDENVVKSLLRGEAKIVKRLPARRIVKVRSDNKDYTRQEFLNTVDDPREYLKKELINKTYKFEGEKLLRRQEKDELYKELKDYLKRNRDKEDLLKSLDEMIRTLKYTNTALTKEDILEVKKWLENK